MNRRAYEDSYPWLTFQYQATTERLPLLLGEAFSKCRHLSGTPLPPGLAARLGSTYLVRGAVATTAIEGNTLRVEDVEDLLANRRQVPESQQYLEQEVRNVLEALTAIRRHALEGQPLTLTPEWIKEQNHRLLKDIEDEDHVVPGEYTTRRVGAGSYLGVPPEDIEYLMDRLCTWLNDDWLIPMRKPHTPDHERFLLAFFAATLAHVYITWIHGFGNGNGRTARLAEAAILAQSGVVPWVSCNLLSDHYNRTRSRYYLRLNEASKANDLTGFIRYAAQGYVDQLREQIADVQTMQKRISWTNYVHEVMRAEPRGATRDRRRAALLRMPEDTPTKRADFRRLDGEIAEMYAGKGDKTVTRDINRLKELGLLRQVRAGYLPAADVMDAFLPIAP